MYILGTCRVDDIVTVQSIHTDRKTALHRLGNLTVLLSKGMHAYDVCFTQGHGRKVRAPQVGDELTYYDAMDCVLAPGANRP